MVQFCSSNMVDSRLKRELALSFYTFWSTVEQKVSSRNDLAFTDQVNSYTIEMSPMPTTSLKTGVCCKMDAIVTNQRTEPGWWFGRTQTGPDQTEPSWNDFFTGSGSVLLDLVIRFTHQTGPSQTDSESDSVIRSDLLLLYLSEQSLHFFRESLFFGELNYTVFLIKNRKLGFWIWSLSKWTVYWFKWAFKWLGCDFYWTDKKFQEKSERR